MQKYKTGDILKVKKGCEGVCANFRDDNGQFIKITEVESTFYYYDILDGDFKKVMSCHDCFSDEHLEPLEKTWETLQEGDTVIDMDKEEREILGVCGKVYFLSDGINKKHSGTFNTIQEMKDLGYKIKDSKTEVCKACGNEIKK